jgi:hypothetical protein
MAFPTFVLVPAITTFDPPSFTFPVIHKMIPPLLLVFFSPPIIVATAVPVIVLFLPPPNILFDALEIVFHTPPNTTPFDVPVTVFPDHPPIPAFATAVFPFHHQIKESGSPLFPVPIITAVVTCKDPDILTPSPLISDFTTPPSVIFKLEMYSTLFSMPTTPSSIIFVISL